MYFNKYSTSAAFELFMFFDSSIVRHLRDVGFSASVDSRRHKAESPAQDTGAQQKAYEIADLSWKRTHRQCYAVLQYIELELTPQITEREMKDAPRVRSFKSGGSTFIAQDEARAKK